MARAARAATTSDALHTMSAAVNPPGPGTPLGSRWLTTMLVAMALPRAPPMLRMLVFIPVATPV
jgi:hypothetical protein